MIWDRKIKSRLVLLSLVLVVVLSSCSSESLDKLWLKSEGWSRGILLGETSLAAPAASAVDSSGKVYSVLFPKSEIEDGLYQPELVVLNEAGEIADHIPLEFQTSQPKQSKIILSEDGIDIFWIDSYQLKFSKINKEGELLSEVSVLSGEERVNNFEVIPWDGGYEIWYAGRQDNPGLYALSGNMDDLKKTLIDPLGTRVNLFLDNEDLLHISWARIPISYGELELYYLQTAPQRLNANNAVKVFSKRITPALRIDGPVLGLDQQVAYMFWSELIQTGHDAGNRVTYYRNFPINQPEMIQPPLSLLIPVVQNIDPVPYPTGTFQTGDRVILGSGVPATPSLENIETLTAQFPETVIVFRSRSEYKWRDRRYQVNIAYLEDGKGTSYQPLSYTSAESNYPAVFHDQENDLYVTWLEKGETTYRVYLTTTDSDKKSSIDQVSLDDYLYLGAEGLFGLLAGAVLAPFAAAVWGGAGLFAFIFNVILSRFNHRFYRTLGEFLSIAGGVLIFWLVKMATLPGLKDGYVPFSAWIPRIPSGLETPLVIGVPILIGLISFTVAWLKTYGKGSGSPINFHFIYSALDTLFSCAVYGILIYG